MCSLLCARSRHQGWYACAGLATIAAGLASRAFPYGLPSVLAKYPGDALWALMVFCFGGVWFRTASTVRLALGALAVAFAVEFLKLLPLPWLANLRSTTLGHLVLGHVFSWTNLLAYAAGVLVGTLADLRYGSPRPSG